MQHSCKSAMALEPFVGPWPLLQFPNLFTQTVGLLKQVISPSQGRYLHTEQHKHRINAYTDIHALSGIRTQDHSFRGSEDSSCLRPRGHCDRLPIFKPRNINYNYIFFNSMTQIENTYYTRTDGPIGCYRKDNNRYIKEY
jgi:hypothetical protein